MDETQIKHVIEAALLAAGRPLPLDTLASLFATKASELDKETLQSALDALATDYRQRGLELKEVASGYRIQIKSSMSEWLIPLWEERAPRYTRALLETLVLMAYRQPITRAEIEEVRGVAVSTNIIRTLMERNWIRVVGHRDVPGKPAMFGTTKDFLDYFGLRKLEDLPPLADVKEGFPELTPQSDLIDALEVGGEEHTGEDANDIEAADASGAASDGPTALDEEAAATPDEGIETAHGRDEAVHGQVEALHDGDEGVNDPEREMHPAGTETAQGDGDSDDDAGASAVTAVMAAAAEEPAEAAPSNEPDVTETDPANAADAKNSVETSARDEVDTAASVELLDEDDEDDEDDDEKLIQAQMR